VAKFLGNEMDTGLNGFVRIDVMVFVVDFCDCFVDAKWDTEELEEMLIMRYLHRVRRDKEDVG